MRLLEGILAQAKARGMNQRQLCVAAGLSDNYMSATLSRARKGEQDDIGRQELAKLLRAVDLPDGWMPPESFPIADRTVEREDPYFTRAQFMLFARESGRADEKILEAIRLEVHKGGDPGFDYWVDLYDQLARRKKRVDELFNPTPAAAPSDPVAEERARRTASRRRT